MYKTRRNGHYFSDDVQKIKDALMDATRGVAGRAGQAWDSSLDDIRSKSVSVQKNVRSYVLKKPVRSIAAAALTGIFLGYFLHR